MLTRARRHLVPTVVALSALATGWSCAAHGDPALVAGARADRAPDAIERYGCGSCHSIPGVRGADGTVGPSLAKFSERGVIAGALPFNVDNLVRWIMDPQDLDPGVAMPDLDVDEQDARDIAEYLLKSG